MMKKSLSISWHGSEIIYSGCSSIIHKNFLESSVPWRKKGSHLPCHISLPVVFVPFEPSKWVFDPSRPKTKLDIPSAHLFFVDALDVHHYSSEIRGQLSEWFSILVNMGFNNWMIVYDSARFRDAKSRSAVVDRLKSDFQKYSSRIIEFDGNSSKHVVLLKNIKDTLVSSVDECVVSFEQQLDSDKARCYAHEWSLCLYIDAQLALCQLYSGLQLYDEALAKYDELDALVGLLIDKLKHTIDTPQAPIWLHDLHLAEEPRCCSLLQAARYPPQACASLTEGCAALLELHTLILARQITAILDQYQAKLASGRSSSLSIQYCGLVLDYAYSTLMHVIEEIQVIQPGMTDEQLSLWQCLTVLEVHLLCNKICDPSLVTQHSKCICYMWTTLCKGMVTLSLAWENEETMEELRQWFPVTESNPQKSGEPLGIISQWLTDQKIFDQQFQKYHEDSMAVLKHMKWKRHSKLVAKSLADFFVKRDRRDEAVPLYMKLLNSYVREKWLVVNMKLVDDVIYRLGHNYENDLLEFNLCLSCHSLDEEKRIPAMQSFSNAAKQCDSTQVYSRVTSLCFQMKSSPKLNGSNFIPGQEISCSFMIHSSLPSQITVKLRLKCMKLMTTRDFDLPRYDMSHNGDGFKLTCFSNKFCGDHATLSANVSDAVVEVNESTPILTESFNHHDVIILCPGSNEVTLKTKVEEVGLYRTQTVHVIIDECTLSMDLLQSDKVLFRVESTPRYLTVKKKSKNLFGGIEQCLSLVAYSGTDLCPPSNLQISCQPSTSLRFMENDQWSPTTQVSLPEISSRNRHKLHVPVYLLLENVTSEKDIHVTVRVNWDERTFNFDLVFQPVLCWNVSTQFVDSYVLVGVELRHCVSEECIELGSANLVQMGEQFLQAKLLNNKLPTLTPRSVYKLMWKLTSSDVTSLRFSVVYLSGSRQLRLRDNITLPQIQPEYEVCCQMTSTGLLCRAESACELVISLRALANRRAENIIAQLNADNILWNVPKKNKLVVVKESGLGQGSFQITPRTVGFLPLPSISLYPSSNEGKLTSDNAIPIYVRTMGKQVHVLSAQPKGMNSKRASAVNLVL